MDIDFRFTNVFHRTIKAYNNPDTRLIISYGGTSSSKSISILQLLTLIALNKRNLIISIIGETYPFLRRATIRDWKTHVMKDLYEDKNWNASELHYRFPSTGSIIQFISADNPDKFRGMRSDISYFEEITNIKEETYTQVAIRTRGKVICSFNPSHEFYIQAEMNRSDSEVIHSTYLDNPYVEESIIKELQQKALLNENFRRVYMLGEWGSYEGLIFREGKNWHVQKPYKKSRYAWYTFGLDWGFTNDPTSIVRVSYTPGALYLEEILYNEGLLNSEIASKIKSIEDLKEIIADSAEPKSIEELKRTYKINIKGAKKGKGSVMNGINNLLEHRIYVSPESTNIIKELRNYRWATDKNGKSLNKPADIFNHAMDATRYAIDYKQKKESKSSISVYSV
jgi:phage terminase large subunit